VLVPRRARKISEGELEMPAMEHVIYASVATEELGAPQLAELLANARAANELAGLTGMLLHSDADGSFFQVLKARRRPLIGY
jgi:hypothetical protein